MCHLPLDNRTSAIISRCETFSAKYLVPLQVIDYRSVNRLLLHCLDIHNVVVAPKSKSANEATDREKRAALPHPKYTSTNRAFSLPATLLMLLKFYMTDIIAASNSGYA